MFVGKTILFFGHTVRMNVISVLISVSITKPPIIDVYKKACVYSSKYPPGLNVVQLRKALSMAGTDITIDRSHLLVHKYGNDQQRIRLRNFDTMVRQERVMQGAQFWLCVDRSDSGIRKSRCGFTKFFKKGETTPSRTLHTVFGGASIIVGTWDMLQFVTHAGVSCTGPGSAFLHAMVHTCAAALSLPRFKYKFDKFAPWKLWMTSFRDANMWPSFIICIWYTLALYSSFTIAENPPFSFSNEYFIALTYLTSASVLYGLVRGVWEDLETKNTDWTLTKVSGFSMLPVLTDTSRALYFSPSEAYDAYTQLLNKCPEFQMMQISLMLGAMYTGNVLCALASAKLHGSCNDEQIGNVAMYLNIVYGAGPFLLSFFIDSGTFLPEFKSALFWWM